VSPAAKALRIEPASGSRIGNRHQRARVLRICSRKRQRTPKPAPLPAEVNIRLDYPCSLGSRTFTAARCRAQLFRNHMPPKCEKAKSRAAPAHSGPGCLTLSVPRIECFAGRIHKVRSEWVADNPPRRSASATTVTWYPYGAKIPSLQLCAQRAPHTGIKSARNLRHQSRSALS